MGEGGGRCAADLEERVKFQWPVKVGGSAKMRPFVTESGRSGSVGFTPIVGGWRFPQRG
jgi:hypothetical protein